jgi:hypothetical protein
MCCNLLSQVFYAHNRSRVHQILHSRRWRSDPRCLERSHASRRAIATRPLVCLHGNDKILTLLTSQAGANRPGCRLLELPLETRLSIHDYALGTETVGRSRLYIIRTHAPVRLVYLIVVPFHVTFIKGHDSWRW